MTGRVDYYDQVGELTTTDAILAKMALRSSLTPDSAKLILAMVGLPARGKSFISHKLEAFLNWSGQLTKIFNAGQKRRSEAPEASASEKDTQALPRLNFAADFVSSRPAPR